MASSSLLTGKRQRLDEVLHPCEDLPRLHVLFAGARNDATPELLASRGMAELCADSVYALSAKYCSVRHAAGLGRLRAGGYGQPMCIMY